MFRTIIATCKREPTYRLRAFSSNATSNIGLGKVVPSNVSVTEAVKRKKQAIMNVLFSFLTCVLGAQVIRYRYMKDELDAELKELRRKRDLGKNSVDEAKLKQLCNEMELNEKQSSLLFAHFQTGTHRATAKKKELDDNIGDKEITKEDSKPVKSFRI